MMRLKQRLRKDKIIKNLFLQQQTRCFYNRYKNSIIAGIMDNLTVFIK